MKKRINYILIAVISFLVFNSINHLSVQSHTLASHHRTHLLYRAPFINSVNIFDFINENEDNFNKDKFHSSFQDLHTADYNKYKIQVTEHKLNPIALYTRCTNLYTGIPIYKTIGNYRL